MATHCFEGNTLEDKILPRDRDDFEGGKEESQKETLNEQVVTHKWKYFFAFFLIGILNNNGYVMV